MNSRSAINEHRPKKTITPIGPIAKAPANTAISIHHALVRAFKFATVACPACDSDGALAQNLSLRQQHPCGYAQGPKLESNNDSRPGHSIPRHTRLRASIEELAAFHDLEHSSGEFAVLSLQ